MLTTGVRWGALTHLFPGLQMNRRDYGGYGLEKLKTIFQDSTQNVRSLCINVPKVRLVLNEIVDPSKATSARPRKLGLRPQTVRVRPAGRCLRPRRVPQNIVGPLRGRAGFGKD